MSTTAAKVSEALKSRGLREYVQGIEDNLATPGEVVVWIGAGVPVYTIEEAVELVECDLSGWLPAR